MNIGDRVQLHPATDHWMRGDRYGTIVGVKRVYDPEPELLRRAPNRVTGYRVKLDKSGKIVRVHPDNVLEA